MVKMVLFCPVGLTPLMVDEGYRCNVGMMMSLLLRVLTTSHLEQLSQSYTCRSNVVSTDDGCQISLSGIARWVIPTIYFGTVELVILPSPFGDSEMS